MTWTDALANVLAALLAWLVGEALLLAGFSFDRWLFLRFALLLWMLRCLWHIGAWMIEDAT